MSRAFVNEDHAAAEAALPPERPVPAGPNLVTPRGHARIGAEVARLAEALAAAAEADRPMLARELRYWRARQATAQVTPKGTGPGVGFGSRVLVRQNGAERWWELVGEDEAEPREGRISWASPLAQALMGAEAGDEVALPGRPLVTVLRVA